MPYAQGSRMAKIASCVPECNPAMHMMSLIAQCRAGDLAWGFACGLIDGMEAVHCRHLVHDDLDERHLRKNAACDPAIIDFSEARELSGNTASPRHV